VNPYTFKYGCESCDQKPVLKDTGMCAVCTFGESDALWDWLGEKWSGRELRLAQQHLKAMQSELGKSGMAFAPDIAPRILQIISFKEAIK
jgi:hypothetical protein